MFDREAQERVTETTAPAALVSLEWAVDELLRCDLTRLDRDDLFSVVRGFETQRRRAAAVAHMITAELEARDAATDVGARDTAALLVALIHIAPSEASARVRAARNLAPGRALGGAVLPPLFPVVAAAQCAGLIGERVAAVITSTIEELPERIRDEHSERVERVLVEQAGQLHVGQVAQLGRRIGDILDPDGTLAEPADHARHRDFTLQPRRDGGADVRGRLDPATSAIWQAILATLGRPLPASDGAPDGRRATQRRHDALHDAGLRLLRSTTLPDTGGTPTTLTLIGSAAPADTGPRLIQTGYGALAATAAMTHLFDEIRLVAVATDDNGAVTEAGEALRCASPAQRRILAARDRGCTFPGCTVPAAWCQAHHVRPWNDGGLTRIANLALVCGHHHRSFTTTGWSCEMINAVPHWRPPAWIDPERQPRRNTAIHLPFEFTAPATKTSEPVDAPDRVSPVRNPAGSDAPGSDPPRSDPPGSDPPGSYAPGGESPTRQPSPSANRTTTPRLLQRRSAGRRPTTR